MGAFFSSAFANWGWLLLAVVALGTIIARWRGAQIVQWLEKRAGSYAEKHMPPSNESAFERRIARRVRWLRVKDWWTHEVKFFAVVRGSIRPIMLLLVGLGLPLIAYWNREWMFPELTAIKVAENGAGLTVSQEVDWRAIVQPALVVIGIPSAFVLWLFRDINAQKDLESKRKDVNLKEFQEIQLRAAGAMDEKLPASARESLQIAATHQLAGFLRGEYGTSFRRPAWELLRARLLASSQAMGYQSIPAQIGEWRKADPATRCSASELSDNIRRAVASIKKDSIGKAQRDALRDEWRTIFCGKLPLSGTVFDGINAPANALIASRDLERCSFIGADLNNVHLEGAKLMSAHLEGASLEGAHLERADLRFAYLEGARLKEAHLEGADLTIVRLQGADLMDARLEGAKLEYAHLEGAILMDAHLEGANLRYAYLQGADLMNAHLQGADLRGARLEGVDMGFVRLNNKTRLTGAIFDDATQFDGRWDTLSDKQKGKVREPWIASGMKHIDQLSQERKDQEEQTRKEAAAKSPA
jgi:uncharacterized protein YjbI with pentapeptide repeats